MLHDLSLAICALAKNVSSHHPSSRSFPPGLLRVLRPLVIEVSSRSSLFHTFAQTTFLQTTIAFENVWRKYRPFSSENPSWKIDQHSRIFRRKKTFGEKKKKVFFISKHFKGCLQNPFVERRKYQVKISFYFKDISGKMFFFRHQNGRPVSQAPPPIISMYHPPSTISKILRYHKNRFHVVIWNPKSFAKGVIYD